MIWLLLSILVVAAIALPPILLKILPPPDPWFEDRQRARDERRRTIRPKHTHWWERILAVLIFLVFCVVMPITVSISVATDLGSAPEYGLAGLATLVILGEVAYLFMLPRSGANYFAGLQDNREQFTRADYLDHFIRLGVRSEVALEVRDHLQIRWAEVRDFPVLPSDGLADVYRMEVSEEIGDILEDCLCREPSDEDWKETPRLDTVEDLVFLVDRLYLGPTASRSSV